MKKTFKRALFLVIMLLLEGLFVGASATCTGGTSLSGWYGMLVSGGGKYLSGAIYFDGNCNVTGDNITGGSGGQYVTTSVAGTYGQNSDGTFTITLNYAGGFDGKLYGRHQRVGKQGPWSGKRWHARGQHRSAIAADYTYLGI